MIRVAFLQAVFELQRRGKFARLADIEARLALPVGKRKRARSCAERLRAKGWIENRVRDGDGSLVAGEYRLTPAGATALATGQVHGRSTGGVGQRRGAAEQQRLWLAMRAMRKFSVPELTALLVNAGADVVRVARFERWANRYLRGLVRAGYVTAMRRAGRIAHLRYLLVRDTGPKAPQVRWERHDVVDANDGQVRAFDERFELRRAA